MWSRQKFMSPYRICNICLFTFYKFYIHYIHIQNILENNSTNVLTLCCLSLFPCSVLSTRTDLLSLKATLVSIVKALKVEEIHIQLYKILIYKILLWIIKPSLNSLNKNDNINVTIYSYKSSTRKDDVIWIAHFFIS